MRFNFNYIIQFYRKQKDLTLTHLFISLFITIGFLIVGLWPFEFSPENKVHWLVKRSGLHFNEHGIDSTYSAGGSVFSSNPISSSKQKITKKNSISIELWLRSIKNLRECPHRILSFLDESENDVLHISQWNRNLIIRRLDEHYGFRKRYKNVVLGQVLETEKTYFITLTSDEKQIAVYIDGKREKTFHGFNLISENESILNKTILLGNSPEGRWPWSGDLFGLALYDYVLSDNQIYQSVEYWTRGGQSPPLFYDSALARYAFDERSGMWAHSNVGFNNALMIPPRLQFKKRILVAPDISNLFKFHFIKDVVLNITGFIPFGFFLSLWLSRIRQWIPGCAFLISIFIGISLSLSIELLQIYLPTRDSSMTDLICNTVGTIIGVTLCRRYFLNPILRSRLMGFTGGKH